MKNSAKKQAKTRTLESLFPQPKVILIDFGLFLHRAVFSWGRTRQIPPTYTCMSMIIGCLSRIGLTPDDEVIVAIDGRGNWRRDIDPQYKANRKDLREKSDIDWPHWYEQFEILVERLKTSTPFQYIKIDKLEADDIIAVSCRYYHKSECVIVSSDSDFEQLVALPNVKIFSPVSKRYKLVKNPYSVLAKKMKKERTDNLLSEVLDEMDFKRRKILVSLLELPKEIEAKVLDKLDNLSYNGYNIEDFPFESLQERLCNIYNSDKVVSYQKCIKREQKKKKQQKERKKNDRISKIT